MVLIITEGFVRYLDVNKTPCVFVEHKLFENYTSIEKEKICYESTNIKYDFSSPIRLLIPNQQGNHININSEGFRGENFNFNEGDYKIFFLGGSTAFGHVASSDEFTISSLIEKELNDSGLDVKVINAGIPGAYSRDEVFYLQNYIFKYSPDMVIFYDGWNDMEIRQGDLISFNEFGKNDHLSNHEVPGKESERKIKTGIITFFAKIDYRTGMGIVQFVTDLLHNPESVITKNIDSEYVNKIETKMAVNWNEACSYAKENKFHIVNIIQPILGTSDRVRHGEENSFSYQLPALKNLELDNEKLSMCKNIIDLRNIFSELDKVLIYYDSGHMSDNGNQVIAKEIAKKIHPLIKE
jgi:lysophospholipase L1-like esterase